MNNAVFAYFARKNFDDAGQKVIKANMSSNDQLVNAFLGGMFGIKVPDLKSMKPTFVEQLSMDKSTDLVEKLGKLLMDGHIERPRGAYEFGTSQKDLFASFMMSMFNWDEKSFAEYMQSLSQPKYQEILQKLGLLFIKEYIKADKHTKEWATAKGAADKLLSKEVLGELDPEKQQELKTVLLSKDEQVAVNKTAKTLPKEIKDFFKIAGGVKKAKPYFDDFVKGAKKYLSTKGQDNSDLFKSLMNIVEKLNNSNLSLDSLLMNSYNKLWHVTCQKFMQHEKDPGKTVAEGLFWQSSNWDTAFLSNTSKTVLEAMCKAANKKLDDNMLVAVKNTLNEMVASNKQESQDEKPV